MNVIRYKPTGSLLNWADSLLNNFFADSSRGTGYHDYPAVDVTATGEGYKLEADLPGLTEKDIDVKVEDNLLTISSREADEKEEKATGYLIRERRHHSFSRSFVLPRDVDREKIAASFKNGVLTLTLTKSPEAQPRQIEIQSAN